MLSQIPVNMSLWTILNSNLASIAAHQEIADASIVLISEIGAYSHMQGCHLPLLVGVGGRIAEVVATGAVVGPELGTTRLEGSYIVSRVGQGRTGSEAEYKQRKAEEGNDVSRWAVFGAVVKFCIHGGKEFVG